MATEIGPGSNDWANPTIIRPGEQSTTSYDSSAGDPTLYYEIDLGDVEGVHGIRIDGDLTPEGYVMEHTVTPRFEHQDHSVSAPVTYAMWPGGDDEDRYRLQVEGEIVIPPGTYTSLEEFWQLAMEGIYAEFYPSFEDDFYPAVVDLYPDLTDAERLAALNESLGYTDWGPVTVTVRLSDPIEPVRDYPEGEFDEWGPVTEDFENFELGSIRPGTNQWTDPIVVPETWEVYDFSGGDPTDYGAKRGPLSVSAVSSFTLEVTDEMAHAGTKGAKHTGYEGWDLETIEVGGGDFVPRGASWSPHTGWPWLEASCWHFRRSAYVGTPAWHINYGGGGGAGGGLYGTIAPGALDWYWSTNGNVGDFLGERNGEWLNEDRWALRNLHFFLERVVNSPGDEENIWEDTGVYAWDQWLQFYCRFDLYTMTFRWEIRGQDEEDVLWSKELTAAEIGLDITGAVAQFGFDYQEEEGGMSPDFLDQIYGYLQRWIPQFDSPLPDPGGYGQINLVQYRYTPVSVNVGYEYGSVESFDYARAMASWTDDRLTDSGVPIPANDPRRP